MKIKIPYLVPKTRHGKTIYHWQPSKKLRDKGWEPKVLGPDFEYAQVQAKAQNEKLHAWREQGTPFGKVKREFGRKTLGKLADKYETSDRFLALAESTQREYQSCLRSIRTWAGEELVDHITPARVEIFKIALQAPLVAGGPRRLARAKNTLSVLYNVLQLAVKSDDYAMNSNPAAKAEVEAPAPRNRVISAEAREAICAAALREGWSAIALGVRIGFAAMQREGDLIRLTERNWAECYQDEDVPAESWTKLCGADGRVMGIRLRQNKTKKWVKVPVTGIERAAIEAAIAANRKRDVPSTTLIVDDETGKPYPDWKFQRRFRACVNAARAKAEQEADLDLVEDLTDIEYRDLRRTGIVFYGELGVPDHYIAAISGHTLERTKKILETYMPRSSGMAANGVAMAIGNLEIRRKAKQEQAG